MALRSLMMGYVITGRSAEIRLSYHTDTRYRALETESFYQATTQFHDFDQ